MENISYLITSEEELPEISKNLTEKDIAVLIELLNEKNDKIRYKALQLLSLRSSFTNDVYKYWDTFCIKLNNENSYQRSIGILLISENTKWDKANKISLCIDDYLKAVEDEKPITVRQCIQSLIKIVPYKENLCGKIAQKLLSVDLMKIKDTMRKLILIDIMNILFELRKYITDNEIDEYVINALRGSLLDSKTNKMFAEKFKL